MHTYNECKVKIAGIKFMLDNLIQLENLSNNNTDPNHLIIIPQESNSNSSIVLKNEKGPGERVFFKSLCNYHLTHKDDRHSLRRAGWHPPLQVAGH